MAADLHDEQGNPIQLADQYGNPVRLTDEYGNPMKLSGVAVSTCASDSDSASALHTSTAPIKETLAGIGRTEQQDHLRRSSSSSSSSSEEDDGEGGRRKKKGLKEKIKEKFSGEKHDGDKVSHSVTTTTSTTSTTTAGQQHPEHEKKSMMDKIKEKLPGHH